MKVGERLLGKIRCNISPTRITADLGIMPEVSYVFYLISYRYELMHTTWTITPEDRPTFEQIVRSLSQLCPQASPQTENPYWVLERPGTQDTGMRAPSPLGVIPSHAKPTEQPKPPAGTSPGSKETLSISAVNADPEEDVGEATYDNVAQVYEVPVSTTSESHQYENEGFSHYQNSKVSECRNESECPPVEYEIPVTDHGSM